MSRAWRSPSVKNWQTAQTFRLRNISIDHNSRISGIMQPR